MSDHAGRLRNRATHQRFRTPRLLRCARACQNAEILPKQPFHSKTTGEKRRKREQKTDKGSLGVSPRIPTKNFSSLSIRDLHLLCIIAEQPVFCYILPIQGSPRLFLL